jgi:hypothetical protein
MHLGFRRVAIDVDPKIQDTVVGRTTAGVRSHIELSRIDELLPPMDDKIGY